MPYETAGGVFASPIPITRFPLSRSLLASLVKSLSLETRQNPSSSLAYSISIASMIIAESVAFFSVSITKLLDRSDESSAKVLPSTPRCSDGSSLRRSFYMLHFHISTVHLRSVLIYFADTLSASIKSANLSSILCIPPHSYFPRKCSLFINHMAVGRTFFRNRNRSRVQIHILISVLIRYFLTGRHMRMPVQQNISVLQRRHTLRIVHMSVGCKKPRLYPQAAVHNNLP